MTDGPMVLLTVYAFGTFFAFWVMVFRVRNIYKEGRYLTWGQLLFGEVFHVIFPIANYVYILDMFGPTFTKFLNTPAFKKKEKDE